MPLMTILPFTFGSGGGGAPPAPAGVEQWIHPEYSRGDTARLHITKKTNAKFGRLRDDTGYEDDFWPRE